MSRSRDEPLLPPNHVQISDAHAREEDKRGHGALEVWGGPECSYVRVGDHVRDQLAETGHDDRPDDLDRFAELGVRALRYPISWERMEAGKINWAWAEARLHRLRALGIRPIVGFVHHGSGPYAEGLLSPRFAPGLAEFAGEFAARFPWVDAYTPVNEPGTTARFSGLYGFWHPHGRDMCCFARCLINQVEATRLAMRAIRDLNPRAQLIQTEDVGKTHAPPSLDYQADFENERRWLSFDLLCGRVDTGHPLRAHLLESGVAAVELDALCAHPCAPDVLGMNHYVTSERFLDERLDLYPSELHGGNGRSAYVDVPALRVRLEGAVGPAVLLEEMWQRYRLPLAVTEVQLACGREDQLRWLLEVWHAARSARAAGVDVRAITAWALLGAHDWDSLLRESRGTYESGAFDLRAPTPRPTAVTRALKALATEGTFHHPILAVPGWWRRPVRLAHPPVSAPRTGNGMPEFPPNAAKVAPLLIIGAEGMLGDAFVRACATRALPFQAISSDHVNRGQVGSACALLERHAPWAVLNCLGDTTGDAAPAGHADRGHDLTLYPSELATACAAAGIKFATFSTSLVFDRETSDPCSESTEPQPRTADGRAQLNAEQRIAASNRAALIIRPGDCFSPWDDGSFVANTRRDLAAGKPVQAARDRVVSPTFAPELADVTLDLLIDDETGLWHLANTGAVSRFDWARAIAARAGYAETCVLPVKSCSPVMPTRCSALRSERGTLLGSWEQALDRYFAETRNLQPKVAA